MAHLKDIDLVKLHDLARIGLSDEQIAISMGISVSTMTRRKKDSEEFAEALKAGKQAGLRTVTNALFESATGEKPNVSAQIFFLKNRGQGQWRDRTEVDANLSSDITVTHDIDDAVQALKEAGIDPAML